MNLTDKAIPAQLPPQSMDAEEAILGGILLDPNAIKRVVVTGLKSDDFYVQAHQEIYKAAIALYADRQPIDLLTVVQRLGEQKLTQVGGTGKLATLVDRTVSAVNVDHYAELVRKKAILRRLIALGHDIINAAHQRNADPEEVLGKLRQGNKAIAEQLNGDATGELVPLSELVVQSYNEIEEAMGNRDNPNWRGEVKSGFTELDRVCVGFAPKDLIVIGGRTGMGKTTFMQNLAINIAQSYGHTLSFHFGELDKNIITKRILSQHSKIGLKQLRNGFLTDKDLTRLMEGVERVSSINLSIDDKPRDMDSVFQAVERWQDINEATPKAIFLDYVQIIRGMRGSRVERLEDIMDNAKYLAGEFNCPVFIGSQINRETEAKTDKRPTISELKGCGGIEEKAQHILLLYRDAYYNRETARPNVTEVNVVKCTNGEPATVELYSSMETFTFGNLA